MSRNRILVLNLHAEPCRLLPFPRQNLAFSQIRHRMTPPSPMSRRAIASFIAVLAVLVPLTFAPDATLNFAALTGGSAPDKRSLPPVAGMPLHPTSGTTGIPKLAARHGVAAIAEAAHYQDAMGIGPDDTILCVVPMSHAYGFGTSAMMPLVSGASVVSSRRFQPPSGSRLGPAPRTGTPADGTSSSG